MTLWIGRPLIMVAFLLDEEIRFPFISKIVCEKELLIIPVESVAVEVDNVVGRHNKAHPKF